jgi:beta-glucosidase
MTYTRFEFDKPILSRPRLSAAALNRGQGALSVQVTVRNVGDRAGVEVPQLYIRERGTSVARPVRELKGFGRVSLQPGESKTLTFSIGQRELALWGAGEKFAVEPAELTLWVAPNAAAGEGITIPIER